MKSYLPLGEPCRSHSPAHSFGPSRSDSCGNPSPSNLANYHVLSQLCSTVDTFDDCGAVDAGHTCAVALYTLLDRLKTGDVSDLGALIEHDHGLLQINRPRA